MGQSRGLVRIPLLLGQSKFFEFMVEYLDSAPSTSCPDQADGFPWFQIKTSVS